MWCLVLTLILQASAGVGVLNNELYVIGGYNGQRAERSCEVFNASTKQWSKIAKLQEGRFLIRLPPSNGDKLAL